MKNLIKLNVMALIVAALLFTSGVKAQTTPANSLRLGIAIETGIPTGNGALGSNFILGGTGRLQYGVSDNFALTFTSGAYHYFPKTIPGTNTTYAGYGLIPIKVGVKEFFAKNIYFGAETGVGIEALDSGIGQKRFILSPALGWADKHWDAAFRYEYLSAKTGSNGIVALRIAYGFGL